MTARACPLNGRKWAISTKDEREEPTMAEKMTKEEFCRRFDVAHPDCHVEIRNYTAISKPVDVKCLACGKIHHYQKGWRAISGFRCCENSDARKFDKVKKWLDESDEFELVKKLSGERIIVKHLVCGNSFEKDIQKFFLAPSACKFCHTRNQRLSSTFEHAQGVLDELFLGQIKLLNYNGRHERCTYRCMKCNQIFQQKFDCLIGSSGCPKCDRRTSLGEKAIAKMLLERGIEFKEQVNVPELGRQRFDFGVYDGDGNLQYFIEVQGEQHYSSVSRWGGEEAFRHRLELDERKREYCKERGVPLYEVKYFGKAFKNLEVLPFFGSTTIPAKGSTVQA
jgi:hypothetical protein